MRAKFLVTAARRRLNLLATALVVAGLWQLVAPACTRGASVAASAATSAVVLPQKSERQAPLRVIAYYFHVSVRCVTCRTIEEYAKEALDQGFPKELKQGIVEWRPVNVQLLENRHFIKDYRLYTRSLVLVKVRDGKQTEWRNLEKVWELVGRKSDFLKYVRAHVSTYLGD